MSLQKQRLRHSRLLLRALLVSIVSTYAEEERSNIKFHEPPAVFSLLSGGLESKLCRGVHKKNLLYQDCFTSFNKPVNSVISFDYE